MKHPTPKVPPPLTSEEDLVQRIAYGWAKLDDECEYRRLPPSRFVAMVRAEVHAWRNGKPASRPCQEPDHHAGDAP